MATNDALREAARKELMRRAAQQELERRGLSATPQTVDTSAISAALPDIKIPQREIAAVEPTSPGGTSSFDQFKLMLESGQLQGVNSGSIMSDVGTQTQKGLIQGVAGMAQMPEAVGGWLADLPFRAYDKAMGNEHKPFPRVRGAIPSPGEVGQMAVDATGIGEAKTDLGRNANTVAQFLPGVVVGGPANMGDKVVRAITGGLGSETLGHAVEGTWAEPYARLLGGLVGGFAPDVARRVATPFPVSQERQRLISVMDNEGVDLTAGQRTGNASLKYMESELGGGPANRVMERQGEQFTQATLARVGETADRATPQVMDRAFNRIGNEFDALAQRNNLPPDAQVATDVAAAVTDYAALVPVAAQPNAVRQFANDLLQVAQNGLTGAQYQAFRSRLVRLARGANADPQLRGIYQDFANALDDAMERSLAASGSPDLGAWRTVRNQYRNMLVVEQAATGAGERAAEGIISPSQLRNATVQKQGRRNYARGDGDFAELARSGEATMKPLPNSGTAGRTRAQNIGAGLTTLLGSVAGSAGGIPGMLMGGLLGLGAPMVAGRTLMSRPVQAYLGNQAFGQQTIPAMRRAMVPLLGAGSAIANP